MDDHAVIYLEIGPTSEAPVTTHVCHADEENILTWPSTQLKVLDCGSGSNARKPTRAGRGRGTSSSLSLDVFLCILTRLSVFHPVSETYVTSLPWWLYVNLAQPVYLLVFAKHKILNVKDYLSQNSKNIKLLMKRHVEQESNWCGSCTQTSFHP